MAEELTMEMNFDRPIMTELPPMDMPMDELPEIIEIPVDEMPDMEMTEMREPEIEEFENYDEAVVEMDTMTEENVNVTSLPPGMREPEMEEPEVIREETPNVRTERMTEEPVEEEPSTMERPTMDNEPKPEEPNANNTTSNNEPNDTEIIEENETGRTDTMETDTPTEETPTETRMAENTETEGEETETNNEERVDARETTNTEDTTAEVRVTKDVSSEVSSVGIKVAKIIAKLEVQLKRVDDKVKAIQYVTLKGIQSEAPNLNLYAKKQFYQPTQLNDGNPDFFNQLNIEQQQIYTNVTLAQYSNADPLIVHKKELNRINTEKQRLLIEIEQLKKNL